MFCEKVLCKPSNYKNTSWKKKKKKCYSDNSWATVIILKKVGKLVLFLFRDSISKHCWSRTLLCSQSVSTAVLLKENMLTWCTLGVSVLRHRGKLGTKVMFMRHWRSFPWQTLGGLEAARMRREEAGVGGRGWSTPETNTMICQSHTLTSWHIETLIRTMNATYTCSDVTCQAGSKNNFLPRLPKLDNLNTKHFAMLWF